MKDCYAVHLIRWFNDLPEKDTRRWYVRLWYKLRKKPYLTQEVFLSADKSKMPYLCLTEQYIIENRDKWTREELGYD